MVLRVVEVDLNVNVSAAAVPATTQSRSPDANASFMVHPPDANDGAESRRRHRWCPRTGGQASGFTKPTRFLVDGTEIDDAVFSGVVRDVGIALKRWPGMRRAIDRWVENYPDLPSSELFRAIERS
jgi:hypothetical protein